MKLPCHSTAQWAIRLAAWLATSTWIGVALGQSAPYGSPADAGDDGPALHSAQQGGWQPTRRNRPLDSQTSASTTDQANDKVESTTERISSAPWAPKSKTQTAKNAPTPAPAANTNNNYPPPRRADDTVNRPYPDRRVSHASATNDPQDSRGPSSIRRTGDTEPPHDVAANNSTNSSSSAPRTTSTKPTARPDVSYGFGSQRPGPTSATRSVVSGNVQYESPKYRLSQRDSYPPDSPFASPRRAGAPYRVAGQESEDLPTPAGEPVPARSDGVYEEGPQMYSDGGGSCNSCDDCEDCDEFWFLPPDWSDNIQIFAGVHAFKGSPDNGVNGNFGFHEGVNIGLALCRDRGLGIQAGVGFYQSDFSGSFDIREDRNQVFFTGGLFHRADCCCGLQYGTVIDVFRDEYNVSMNLVQLRSEVSYLGEEGNEIGFWTAYHLQDDTDTPRDTQDRVTWRPVDQYNIFFRRHFCHGGDGRIWGGVTGNGEGLIGADMRIPFSCSFAIEPSFNYLIPKHDEIAFAEEGWNVAINLVWYPHCRARKADCSQFRPLFNVADNGTFMIHSDFAPNDD